MATADTARLIASLELKDMFSGPSGKIVGSLGRLDKAITGTQGRAYKAGQQIGTGIKTGAVIAASAIGFLASQVGFGLRSLVTLEKATGQTNARIKSTGGIAGVTAKEVRDLAEEYENLNATIDDKVIQSAENLLLTFTNIRKQAFEPALLAALNMNTALGRGEEGLQGTVQQLGKALNDPIKGLTALGRVGITFTKQQKDQIKAAVAAGDTFKAQGVILGELEKRFGGSFKTAGESAEGTFAGIGDAVEDLQKTVATGLMPVIRKVLPQIRSALSSPEVVKGAKDIGDAIASMFSDENLKAGADFLKGAFQTAKEAAPIVRDAAKATFGLVQAAVGLFRSLPKEIQGLAIGAFAINKITGGLVTNIAGGLISSVLKQLVSGVVNVAGGVVNVAGVPGVGSVAPAVAGAAAPTAAGAAAGLGFGTIAAGVAAGTAVAALGIMGLGWLITATSSPEQLATNAQNAIDENRRKHGLGGPAASTAPGSPFNSVATSIGERQEAILGATEEQTRAAELNARRIEAEENRTGQIVRTIGAAQAKAVSASTLAFRQVVATLRNASGAKQVAAAIKTALSTIFKEGKGGSGGAANTLAALKSQLARTHDPELQRQLTSAIGKVERKLAARRIVEDQLKEMNRISKSGATSAQKIEQLKGVLRIIGNKNASVTKQVQQKIDEAKRAATIATNRLDGHVRKLKLSPKISIPINVRGTTVINGRSFVGQITRQTTFVRPGHIFID